MRGPTKLINCFHPDFVKTHMPEFMTEFRTADARRQAAETLSGYVTETRKAKPSHGIIAGLSKVQRETIPNQKFQDISAFPKTRKVKGKWGGARDKSCPMTMDEVASELAAVKKTKGKK